MSELKKIIFPADEFVNYDYVYSTFLNNTVFQFPVNRDRLNSLNLIKSKLEISSVPAFTAVKLLANQKFIRTRTLVDNKSEILIPLQGTFTYIDHSRKIEFLEEEFLKVPDDVSHYSLNAEESTDCYFLFLELETVTFSLGLRWKNFLSKENTNLSSSNNIDFIENTAPEFENKQILLYNRTDDCSINFEDFLNRSEFKNNEISFFIFEPLKISPIPISNNSKNELHYYDFDNEHSGLIWAKELDDVNEFTQKYGLDTTVYTCDYNLKDLCETYPSLKFKTFDLYIRNIDFTYFPILNSKIEKPFWCGNHRYDIHRHLILSFLMKYQGNYTCKFSEMCDSIPNKKWIGYDRYPDKLKSRIEKGNEKIHKKTNISTYEPDEFEFLKTFEGCFCSIVTETRFAQPLANISEKVLYSMLMKRPFILVAPPKSLEYIKKLGFKTFNKYWNEEYDNEFDHSLRMQKIFELIDNTIGKMSIEQLQEMYDDMKGILTHNRRKVLDLYQNNIIL